MNTIYLVRHGENPANITKEFSSRKVDYSLNARGILQARQTGEYFRRMGIDEVYASPLKRARETGEIIAATCGLTCTVTEHFREIDVGDLEGQPVTEEAWAYHDRIFDDWLLGRPETGFPNGDTYFSLWGRIRAGVLQAIHGKSGKKIVIVGHGGIFTATIQDLCPQVNVVELAKKFTANCGITTVTVEERDGQPVGKLMRWDESSHLHGEASLQVYPKYDKGTFDAASASD